MTNRTDRSSPTDAELRLLQVLWSRGASTVRELHSEVGGETAYTTVLKLLQIMHEKGLVERDESERAHVYSAAPDRETVEKGLVGELLERAFAGSASRLVMRALSARPVSAEERREIETLLRSLPDEAPGSPDARSDSEADCEPPEEKSR